MNGSGELARLDALAQAELVRTGQATSVELVEAAIARIEQLNPELNAVIMRMFEEALEAAAGPLPDGSLSGVPFLLKDLGAAYGGVRQTSGSRALADHVPPDDDDLVRRFRRAGLVMVGRTNTPSLATRARPSPSCSVRPTIHGTQSDARRVQWRLGSGRRSGTCSRRACERRRRVDPHARIQDAGVRIDPPPSTCRCDRCIRPLNRRALRFGIAPKSTGFVLELPRGVFGPVSARPRAGSAARGRWYVVHESARGGL